MGGVTFMDPLTSVVALLIVGFAGALSAQALRLPRVVGMILLGIAVMPAMHPTILTAGSVTYGPSGVLYGPPGAYTTQNPASQIRTFALLVALMRGGLSVKGAFLRELSVPIAVIATVPYALELLFEALAAPSLLPAFFGSEVAGGAPPALVSFTAASVWAPLSPSIVIPNMLHFVEQLGLTRAGQLVLTGAPLEVSTALVTEGVLSSVMTAISSGSDSTSTLGHIPVFTVCSVLYGLAFTFFFWVYVKVRPLEQVVQIFGKPEAVESRLVFVFTFVLCYTTSQVDDNVVPWLTGFFAALCMAIGTQHVLPQLGDEICASLKPAWAFAESMLFVLTGCVIRPAIDSGLALDLFGWFFALLLIGTLGRMIGDIIAGICWHSVLTKSYPWQWERSEWPDVMRRIAFIWMATLPKATLQGSLGPKLTTTFKTAGYLPASTFIAPSAAIAILYAASIGSLLTFTVGRSLAAYFQEQGADVTVDAEAADKGADLGVNVLKGDEPAPASPAGVAFDTPASPSSAEDARFVHSEEA